MYVIGYETTFFGTDISQVTGLTDLDIGIYNGNLLLFATSRANGGVTLFDLDPGAGQADFYDIQYFSGGLNLPTGIELMTLNGQRLAIATGGSATDYPALTLNAGGSLTGTLDISQAGNPSGSMTAFATVNQGGETYLIAGHHGETSLYVYRVAADETLEPVYELMLPVADFSAMQSVNVGGSDYILTASSSGNEITLYRIDSGGVPVPVAQSGADDGLGIATPTEMETVTIAGATYVIVAASGSSSLSVLEVTDTGGLNPVDHVIDGLTTRFASVSALEVITVGERVFVAAGGADDGFSLFQLLPGGQLLWLATIEDEDGMSLQNVTSIAGYADGNTLNFYVSSEIEAGISQFSVNVGGEGSTIVGDNAANTLTGTGARDVLDGGNGDDILSGGGGDDVLVDGAGADQMTGGGGRDIFVLLADGDIDRITDFDPVRDRIDLSAYPMLRNNDQLQITPTATGAQIVFGAETLIVDTIDGSSLTVAQVLNLTLITADHALFGVAESGLVDEGSAGQDVMIGTSANDILSGLGGDDILIGGDGQDTLDGGSGQDVSDYSGAGSTVRVDLLDPSVNMGEAAGDVLVSIESLIGGDFLDMFLGDHLQNWLYGGGGNDILKGRGGRDRLFGGDGDDYLNGGRGNDRIEGQDGNDTLLGYGGKDAMWGGRGNDTMRAGNGNDTLYGGKGNDAMFGENGEDFMGGGYGNDTMDGGQGKDKLYGEDGDDTLSGGTQNDRLEGGNGNDLLQGDAGHDGLYGGHGNDDLYGGSGNDRLLGGKGKDRLDGGTGDDTLTGGYSADTFVFSAGGDIITDFENDLDRLLLDPALWGGSALTVAQVLSSYASVSGTTITFDFGEGNSLVLEGMSDIAELTDDIAFL